MPRPHPSVYPLVAAASWGTNAVAGRFLVGQGHIDGVALTLLRFALATPLILAAAVFMGERVRAPLRDVLVASLLGVFGVAGFNVFFYSALGYMEAALVSLITSLITPMTYVAGILLGMDRLDLKGGAGVALSLAGAYLILGPTGSDVSHIGALLAFAAAVSWTIYTLGIRGVASRMGPTASLFWSSLLGTIVITPLAYEGIASAEYNWVVWALILYVAVVPGALGYAAWNLGVRLIGPVTPSIFIPVVPLTATMLAWLILGETLTPAQMLGGFLIISAILLVVTRRAGPS